MMCKFIFAFLVFATLANLGWADVYDVVIVEIYDGGQSIKVAQTDNLTKEKKLFFVSIDAETKISGNASAAVLKPGDALSIDAVEIQSDRLSAKTISMI
jgi:protein involved in polysaccharide export with SLBB domain